MDGMKKILLTVAITSMLALGGNAAKKHHDAGQFPLLGKAAGETKVKYSRLPDSLENKIRKPLWELGLNSAGMAIRFASNSTSIGAHWVSLLNREMNHMTPVGIRGLDLYCLQKDGSWTFVNSGRPVINKDATTTTIASGMEPEMREYMLYLPLYDGIDSLTIITDSASIIRQPSMSLPKREKPLVFYGTSILQGACASRPGMAHTNMISRKMNREVINLGFSGNAQLDPEIAEFMTSIDAGIYVLDFAPNVTSPQIDEKMETFVKILREKRPDIPILIIESPRFPMMRFNKDVKQKIDKKNADLYRHYKALKEGGMKKIYFMSSEKILGNDNESTVDGNHFTDVGFMRYTEVLLPVKKKYVVE